MQKYNVVEEIEIMGETRSAGSVVELEDADAAPLVEAGKLSLVPEVAEGVQDGSEADADEGSDDEGEAELEEGAEAQGSSTATG